MSRLVVMIYQKSSAIFVLRIFVGLKQIIAGIVKSTYVIKKGLQRQLCSEKLL